MIEIEIKCKLTKEQEVKLLECATFIGEEHLTDVYYDSATYELSVKDFWLRARNGKFVLKMPATQSNLLSTQANAPKHEIEDESEIRTILNVPHKGSLVEDLEAVGFKPLYTLAKTRKKYSKEGFIIDLDHATFEQMAFDLCEIETMVERIEEVTQATEKLRIFVEKHGISIESVPGNLIALIKMVNPEHFRLLEQAQAERIKNR